MTGHPGLGWATQPPALGGPYAVLLKNQNPWSPYGPSKAGGWVAHPNPGWPVITNVEIQTKLKLSGIANCIPWNNPPPPPPPKKKGQFICIYKFNYLNNEYT